MISLRRLLFLRLVLHAVQRPPLSHRRFQNLDNSRFHFVLTSDSRQPRPCTSPDTLPDFSPRRQLVPSTATARIVSSLTSSASTFLTRNCGRRPLRIAKSMRDKGQSRQISRILDWAS